MPDKYITRRQILEAVSQSEPAAASVSDICLCPPIEMNAAIGPVTVASECAALAERGYLQNLRPGRAPLYRLTAAGRGQLDREEDLQEFIWGEYASKFAG